MSQPTIKEAIQAAGATVKIGNEYRDKWYEYQKLHTDTGMGIITIQRKLGSRGCCWSIYGDIPYGVDKAYTRNLSHGEALWYAIEFLTKW